MVHILLVEDNPADVRLTFEAFKECRWDAKIHSVCDGMEALDFLRNSGKYSECQRPNLIFMDINLPRKNGLETLKEIKEDISLRNIPVAVLSSSSSELDIHTTYERQANCYLKKPVELDAFIEMIEAIRGFWFSFVQHSLN